MRGVSSYFKGENMGYSSSQAKAFINEIGPIVQKYAKQYGYQVASPIIAQAICESAAGTSGLSARYHNYFGLKAGSQKKGTANVWDGTVANLSTKEEYTPGTLTTIKDLFRVYKDMDEGVHGYFEFLMFARYQNLKTATDYVDFLTKIKNDGYCTSNSYIRTCSDIVKRYDLTRFDWNDSKPVSSLLKSTDEIAKEVIDGKWGTGAERKRRLALAGYDFVTVQSRVNEMLK